MSGANREGLVVYKSSRNVRVRTDDTLWLCSIRGKFRGKSRQLPVVVGDRVLFQPTAESEGVLEEILPRRNELRRARVLGGRESPAWKSGGHRGSTSEERIIASNVDQVLVVLAARVPPPRWGLVDRVLVSGHFEQLEAAICLNKWDQVADDADESRRLEEAQSVYRGLGYPVFQTSMLEGQGAEALKLWVRDKLTVLSGHSGVGKSTLLNWFCPTENVPTGEVSEATGRGRHVTTAMSLYDVPDGGYLVDTPGYREYGLFNLDRHQLGRYYDEFQPFIARCRFKDCLHVREPKCGVLEALETGEISRLRYRNYRQILDTLSK